MTDRRYLLVFSDRETAESVAEEVADRFGSLGADQRVIRETLAGEDDDEDAQWLVSVSARLDRSALADLADDYEGWLETD
ncbi:hypothetical protein FB566_4692 [Stackebrandtia endophytica]|uniref:Uncharacterized protein n=1 Tax=Stackebrandtia endophytica TaxID=1496996 RepID=A0A543B2P7_9ACTN|nr:hypothetical protein [Stackebrandtia endophytica]TQL79091.1 hypothetical protein FB566_4692 [Stackebrandtia endophytica]